MQSPLFPKFLVVDDNSENRFFVTKTLLRKFPQAIVQEVQESVPAKLAASSEKLAAIIVHRAVDLEGVPLIKELRSIDANIPILMVSGRIECPEAFEAGANAFLNYDAWLRIGTVVEELVGQQGPKPGRSSLHLS